MELRDARPDDAMGLAGVHIRSWQAAYRGLLSEEYLNGLRAEDRAAHYDFSGVNPERPATIVAVDSSAIIGFATIGPCADKDVAVGTGELMALYVDPVAWGRGVGRRLIGEARSRLHSRGFTRARLWVLAGNIRAERFYRRDGWAHSGLRRSQRVWSVDVDEAAYETPLG